ncbi:putative Gti1/Pac2 family protein [Seiridium cardinale]
MDDHLLGSMFVFAEGTSGIGRWTDGSKWSPSRIDEPFLYYQGLERPIEIKPKKGSISRRRHKADGDIIPRTAGNLAANPTTTSRRSRDAIRIDIAMEMNSRQTLQKVSRLKPHGMIKRTIKASMTSYGYRLVSYYTWEDAYGGGLQGPIHDPQLNIIPVPFTLSDSGIPPEILCTSYAGNYGAYIPGCPALGSVDSGVIYV